MAQCAKTCVLQRKNASFLCTTHVLPWGNLCMQMRGNFLVCTPENVKNVFAKSTSLPSTNLEGENAHLNTKSPFWILTKGEMVIGMTNFFSIMNNHVHEAVANMTDSFSAMNDYVCENSYGFVYDVTLFS